jgi:hypothetical protein
MYFAGKSFFLVTLMMCTAQPLLAGQSNAPWGKASLQDKTYAPQKVVYDVAVADQQAQWRMLSTGSAI